MAVDPWMDRETFPLLFVEGTPVFCPPTFYGVDIFGTSARGIHWMIEAIFVTFTQLILMKIIKTVVTRCQILRLKCTKFNFGWSCGPDPAGGAYSAPPDPLAGFNWFTSKERAGG